MYRSSQRDELVRLRALLKVACLVLAQNKIPFPKPLAKWWTAQRNLEWLKLPKAKRERAEITVDMAAGLVREGYNGNEAD